MRFLPLLIGLVLTANTGVCAAWAQHKVSPDGRRYLYYAADGEGHALFTIGMDGTGLRRLTHHAHHDYNPQWSPDGKQVLFYRKHPEEYRADLYLIDAPGGRERQLTDTPHYDGDPAFFPDGRRIVFTSNRDGDFEVYTMPAAGGEPRQLTFNDAADFSAAPSPDGRRIAFVSDRTGSHELYVMQADGSGPAQVTHTGADNYKPVWSPDGARLAFFSNRDGGFEVYVAGADGSLPVNVSRNPDGDDFSLDWTPDGRAVLVASAVGGRQGVYRMEVGGGERTWLFDPEPTADYGDPRDGRRYPTVRIGAQVWMGRNLAYPAEPSWCYEDDERDCDAHGRLYPWEVAVAACPEGWHLASDAEWLALEAHLGMPEEQLRERRFRGTDQGRRLREGGGTGFDALMSGYRRPDGSYDRRGARVAYWTSTPAGDSVAWHRDLRPDTDQIYRSPVDWPYALSVRCIRD